MTIIPPAPPRPPNEWGTFTPRHFAAEAARRNIGPFTYSNFQTQGLNAGLRARAAELESMKKLGISPSREAAAAKPGAAPRAAGNGVAGGGAGPGPVSPSAQAAGQTGPAGPRGWNQNPSQPVRAPRPTVSTPGTRPGQGPIGGGAGGFVGSYVLGVALTPVFEATRDAGRSTGLAIGTATGIRDTPEEFEAKPGWYKRWACFNAARAGVNDPRCEEVPPPQSNSEMAGEPPTYGAPTFTGGQSAGVCYLINFTNGQGSNESIRARGPIGGMRTVTIPGGGRAEIFATSSPEPGTGTTCSTMTGAAWYFTGVGGTAWNADKTASITSIVRVDGAPDTGGNPQGSPGTLPAERPQRSAPPPASGPFNPEPLPQTAPATPATPPATPLPTPELEPTNPAPNRPPDRKVAPVPVPTPEPPIAPDGSPTGNPAPDATPNNVPVGGTATLPNGTTVTKTAGGYEVSVPLSDPRPLVSPRPVETPDGETINPGETITEEKKAGGLPWWLTSPPLVAKIPQGNKVNATDPSTFTDPAPPATPPPSQPATGNGCRCNAPINNRLDKLDEKLTKALGGVSAAGDAGILTYLQRMQSFAEKAWETTRIQKAINALTLVTTLHNAYYLSRDVGATLGEMISLLLDTVGIDDEAGNPLDINTMVGNKVKNAVNAALGEQLATNIGNALTKASRIYQSASNVIWSIRNITDSTTDLLEIAANNTGKIGNSLRLSKVVDALTMPRFSENYKAGDVTRRKMQRILDGIEQVDDTVGTLYAAVATVRDVQEEIQVAGQAKNTLIEEVRTLAPRTDVPENEPVAIAADEAAEASQAPNAQPVDLEPADATP